MLTIGQMARMFGISTKTLRHYEAVGVFRPVFYGRDNGYRYYAPLQISTLRRILWLRSLELSLDLIRDLSVAGALEDEANLRAALETHAAVLASEIAAKQRLFKQLRTYIDHPSKEESIMSTVTVSRTKPSIAERPAFTVIGMEYDDKLGSIPHFWQLYLPREHEITHRVENNVCYGLCISGTGGDLRYVAGVEVSPGAPVPAGMVAVEVPAQRYAVFTHIGTVEGISDTFSYVYQHGLEDNGLHRKPGIDFERYDDKFVGPMNPASQMDLYFPIS